MKNSWLLVVIRVENQRTATPCRNQLSLCCGVGWGHGKIFFLENDCGIEKSCIFAADFEPRW